MRLNMNYAYEKHRKPVIVDGQEFPSYQAAAKYAGVTSPTIAKAIRTGRLKDGREVRVPKKENGKSGLYVVPNE
jgi:hypothetical protein